MVKIDDLPPYGFVNEFLSDGVSTDIPKPMRLAGKRPSVPTYRRWVDKLADNLAENVWPRYHRSSHRWVGSARQHAVELTLADFELLNRLMPYFERPIDARARSGGPVTLHKALFSEEDAVRIDMSTHPPTCTFEQWGQHVERYDDRLKPKFAKQLGAEFDAGVGEVAGELAMQLKEHMQRPRAYQAALLHGKRNYVYRYAYTAATPSMVSGHALESALSGCHVYLNHKAELEATPDAVRYWQQYVVDVGDRRVFAGVHYPSDSMASWYCALYAAPFLFGRRAPQARAFLWQAISSRSVVHRVVARYAKAHPASPHARILNWLALEAAG